MLAWYYKMCLWYMNQWHTGHVLLYALKCKECVLWLPPVFYTYCHCCLPHWATLHLRLHNCCFEETARLLQLGSEKSHFISLYHHIGASNFIADCSAYPVTLPHTHRHNERLSSFYFGSSLVNCKSCQRLWLIVVFITILLSNQTPPQLGPELLNFS